MVFPIFVAGLLAISARAANDWSKPCFGTCDWDVSTAAGSGTMRISGSQSGVSDLTTAAGWTTLDCDSDKADQDIRLVCHDPTLGCDHVNQNGAEGTLVRLPPSCGSIPFAVVTRQWVHQNQSIPAGIKRQDRGDLVVKGMSLATDFNAVDAAQNGNVSLYLQGSSIPRVANNFTVEPPTGTLTKRGLASWVGKSLLSLGKLNKTLSGSSPLNFEKDATLFDQSFDCPQNGAVPGFSGEAKVDLSGKVNGTLDYGVAAAGTIIPPHFDDFGLFVSLDSDIVGTLGINTTLTGSLSSGQISLFQVGIPGLDFPKVLSVGPTFTVNAEATASLDANLDMDVDLVYSIKGAKLFFPPSYSPSGTFTPGDSNLDLAVSPNVTSHGQVAAHLIPSLAFGIDALDGVAKATIHLDLDTSAALDLSLSATGAQASMGTNGTSASGAVFGGCVDVTTGLDVVAGADAGLFGLFDKDLTVPLFQKTFDLFKKCYGSSPARRAYTGRVARAALMVKRGSVGCPTDPLGAAASVVQELIPGLSLQ